MADFSSLNRLLFNLINSFAGKNILIDKLAVLMAEYMPFVFVLFLLFLWFKKDKNIALYLLYSSLFGLLVNFLITLFYFHPRPFMDGIGTLLIEHAPETSFPSDHTTLMLSIAFMSCYFREYRKVGIIFSVLGIFGGISRVFCGIHYPFDIMGSILVAIFSSSIIFVFRNELRNLNDLIVKFYYKVLKYGKKDT